ncbi:hypothetical protein ACSFB8_07550 [Enterococcus faecalis]
MNKAKVKILTNKINALKTALENNDIDFIGKWHGTSEYALKDLEELKTRLNHIQQKERRGL